MSVEDELKKIPEWKEYFDERERDKKFFEINMEGQALEKEGKIDEAIEAYMKGIGEGTDTPFTYKRLAILFEKQKRYKEALKIVDIWATTKYATEDIEEIKKRKSRLQRKMEAKKR